MSFRKELKIPISISDMISMKADLIKMGMRELHPKREIFSVYFDTMNLTMFSDSEEGVLPRKKIRIRSYPIKPNNYLFEKKISSFEGRFKESQAITSCEEKKMKLSGVIDNMSGICFPTAVVSYQRSYFSFSGIRITCDSEITYQKFNSQLRLREPSNVVEIKAPFEAPDDFLLSLIGQPLGRFSKYCRAIHRLQLAKFQ